MQQHYAQRVRWTPETHRVDLSRAVIGAGELTPLHDVAAPTLHRLPIDIAAQLKRDFWKRHDAAAEWSGKYAAQEWLADEVSAFEREKVHRAFDEEEIRALAQRWADLCMRMQRLEVMQDFARSVQIDPPEVKRNVTRVGAARRLMCARWWRRQIRKVYLRRAEAHLRARGFVHKRRQVYASDRAVENRGQRKARDRALLQELEAVSDAGDQLNLWEVAQKSQANPALRRAELMTRLRGFEEVAQLAGHVAEFVTLTCPSAFHRTEADGRANPRWAGFSPREGQQWLCKQWQRARAKLARLSIRYYGFRIAEPHHDGTPHWHMVLFCASHAAEALQAVLRGVWLSEFGDEPGAGKHRANFKRIDPAKGSAAGYLAKYVAKNIDGFEVGEDHETQGSDAKDSCDRVAAWASAHGIRQFQQLGGPSVCVWRECRRIRAQLNDIQAEAIEAARQAADAGEWANFITALGGIEQGRGGRVALWTERTGDLNQYDELRGSQIVGVQSYECRSGAGVGGEGAQGADSGREGVSGGVGRNGGGGRGDAGASRIDLPADGRAAGVLAQPFRIRTRCKVWRIQRKKGSGLADVAGARERAGVILPLPSSLGPVSITVRESRSVPSVRVTGAHGSHSTKGPPWMN